ncbi:hypothetical protein [Streptomyces collinus]|uniref:Uncharacterized protein n=1 Tax=Streptomyces collinus (strain DSM 40733 / Tue 365) TaxID=1214242 RepID=S5UXU3_STRC3|nr:hypothetical protein [Streptomyces collinus]AGS72098.1 hypothetical protein B446_26450 [Streptomyces collinus Tu 365]UJA10752.1 hypothetical protein HGI10_47230 [Streptomyces collinus]UJA14384.1 hypothetical protein HGI09_16890 [Streptomyces collinus]
MGQRIVQAVWRRVDEAGRAELERAVREQAGDPEGLDTAAALRAVLKQALRNYPESSEQLATLAPVPAAGSVTISTSGEKSIATLHIGTAITGDGHTPRL